MSKDKFTFRKEPRETGLRAVGHPTPNTTIKHDGLEVGTIYSPSWSTRDCKWRVDFAVNEDINEDGNSNCSWRRVMLRNTFDSEPEARAYLQEHASHWIAKGLHHS